MMRSVLSIKKIGDDLENGSYRLIDRHYYKTIRVKDHYGVELRITNVTEDDFGLYTCFVSNHIGKDYNSAFLSRYDSYYWANKSYMARNVCYMPS